MVDTIKFSQMTNAGNINNNDIMPSLRTGENVILNNPWTFLPPGTTAERPLPSSTINYRLRFNTEDQLYEYYDAVLSMWTQIQESAFTQGPFITYTASPSLPDAQNLGALANGILKQTITLGVATLNIAVNGTDFYGPGFVIPGTDGGTGVNNGAKTINLGTPTTGFVLTSDSSGNATWQSVSASGSITTIDGDSGSASPVAGVVTVSGGITGLTTSGSGATLTLGGLLNSTFGGTGLNAPTAHGIMIGEGTSPMTPIVLTSGQILIGSTGADPVAAAINSGTGILVGNSAGSITVSLAAIASHDILSNITGGSAAPIANTLTATIDAAIGSTQGNILYRNATSWVVLAPGTAGNFLTSGGAAANVSWSAQVAPTGQALTEVNDTNVTMTLGGSPTTALLAATSMTLGWTGQLSIARGGTSVGATPTSASASNFAAWDTNVNIPANNFNSGYTTTATAAGTTTLTVGSTQQQFFTGSTTQTVVMPVTSTLVLGQTYKLVNNSSGAITVNSSGANNILTMSANTAAFLTCILTSGTTAASWYYQLVDQNEGGGVTSVGSGTGLTGGPITSTGTLSVTGALASIFGLTTIANQMIYTTASNTYATLTSSNSSVLVANSSGVPTFSRNIPLDALIAAVGGHNFMTFTDTGSAVNYFTLQNSATGNPVILTANGSDTNIGMILNSVGTKGVAIRGASDASVGAAGYVGEQLSQAVAYNAVSLSTGTSANVASVTLTPGEWEYTSYVFFSPDGTTTTSILQAGVNTTSATIPNALAPNIATPINFMQGGFAVGSGTTLTIATGTTTVSSNTPLYLVAKANFAVSTMTAGGFILATRIR